MTVRRGVDWGQPERLGAGAPIVADDLDLAALVLPCVDWDAPDGPVVGNRVGPVAVRSGDLHRTLGGPQRRDLRDGTLAGFSCDVLLVEGSAPDGTTVRAVAVGHVLAAESARFRPRPALWSTWSAVVMNAAFVGERNLGPRAHPGDGLADVTTGRLTARDRRRADRRSRTGTHVPHPDLEERRVREWTAPTGDGGDVRSLWVVVDGADLGPVVDLSVRIAPGAVHVLV